MSTTPITVTGIGITCAAGCSPEEVWSAVENETSGLGPLTLFSSPRCGHVRVGQVKEDPATRSGSADGSRTNHLAVATARQAFANAGLESAGESDRRRIGVLLGTTTGGILESESFLNELLVENTFNANLLRHHQCAAPTNAVARALRLGGFRATVSNACASGATAIAAACDLLETGEAKVMLAGGVDSLARLTLNGFCSLLNVDPDGCRPFDAARKGLSLGEGAGMLVLEPESRARARGARILARISGHAANCDAHHPTAPRPDGAGATAAMQGALSAAGIAPADVDYINAHGTGTLDNDLAEACAIRAVFGDRVPGVSSTKRFFGHTLAAAGAIEAIICILALEKQRIPANLGLEKVDPDIGIEPVAHNRDATMSVALTNSLGFWGNNSSLVIDRRF